MVYTSRFANPELKSGEYTAVRISLGSPRWKLSYEIAGAIPELMPRGIFGIEDYNEFHRLYYERLDSIGVDKIREQIRKFEALGKPVVLLCFEDVRKPDDWCHRSVFASWWMLKTGEVIPELVDNSPVKGVKSKVVQGSLSLKSAPVLPPENLGDSASDGSDVADEKEIIWSVYSLWHEDDGWHGSDMFYQVDKTTGKKTRIADAVAKDLVEQGKAELVRDEDSMARIKFVLHEEPASKAYWMARDGTEREMDFESALKLIREKKARIQDIATE